MVQNISGKKGKGKSKYLLDSVNGAVDVSYTHLTLQTI